MEKATRVAERVLLGSAGLELVPGRNERVAITREAEGSLGPRGGHVS
jgi:hypothetical protein